MVFKRLRYYSIVAILLVALVLGFVFGGAASSSSSNVQPDLPEEVIPTPPTDIGDGEEDGGQVHGSAVPGDGGPPVRQVPALCGKLEARGGGAVGGEPEAQGLIGGPSCSAVLHSPASIEMKNETPVFF